MKLAAGATLPANRVVFQDGLGKRLQIRHPTSNEMLEVLKFHPALTAFPSFEFAVRERVTRLAGFREARFARVRGVGRRARDNGPLLLISDVVPGVRLSTMLAAAQRRKVTCDLETAVCLVRQLTSAVASLHEYDPAIAHCAIGPERIVITPDGRLVVAEHVLAAGLERFQWPADLYWQDFGIALPPWAGIASLGQRTDVMQIGLVALCLLIGRPLQVDEYPSQVSGLLASVSPTSRRGTPAQLPFALRLWLKRVLQFDTQSAFASALEAWADLEALLADGELAVPATAEEFVRRCDGSARPARSDTVAQPDTASTSPALVSQRAASTAPAPIAGTLVLAPTPARKAWSAIALRLSELPAVLESNAIAVHQRSGLSLPAPAERLWSFARSRRVQVAASAALIACAGIGIFGWQKYGRTGTLSLETTPAGAQAVVDGTVRGATPLTLALAAGSHTVELRRDGQSRKVPITIKAGEVLSQSVELPKSSQWGQLEVRTDPPGAQIIVDEVPLGTSPMRIDLASGEYSVELRGQGRGVSQRVTIRPATTTSLVVPLSTAPLAAARMFGWISIAAPVDVQVYERGQLLGSSQSSRIMVSAGRHDLDIVNEVLGYRQNWTVQVGPGAVASVKVQFPNGLVTLIATPSAEVWIDGKRAGETPLNNLAVPLGPHEILFRHPQLGEQRHAITVTLAEPVRLSIDLTKR